MTDNKRMPQSEDSSIIDTFRQLEAIGKFLKRTSFIRTSNPKLTSILDLSVRQLACLGGVSDLTRLHPEGIALKQIASFLHLTLPAASLLVDSMVKKGLLQRKENPNDRRVLCILLSEEGKEAFAELSKEMDVSIRELITCISKEDQKNLSRIVQQLFTHIQ